MTLLTLPEFCDLLPLRSATFTLPDNAEMSETAGGDLIKRVLGAQLWQGKVEVSPRPNAVSRGLETLIHAAKTPGTSFLWRDKSYRGPADDPDGSQLAGVTASIVSQTSDGDLLIDGLPPGFWIRSGDYFSFSYGSNPVRYALHRSVFDRRANAGTTNPGRVRLTPSPAIRPGWTAGTVVEFVRPVCKAVIVPGTVAAGVQGQVMTNGLGFEWRQTLR